MRLNEIVEEALDLPIPTRLQEPVAKLEERFAQLGISAALGAFMRWFWYGKFKLDARDLDRYEQSFWLINSVLPASVIRSYSNLPTMYRGMSFSPEKAELVYSGGLPIKSRISAWTPDKEWAIDQYTPHTPNSIGIVLKHKPKQKEVILALNNETMKFLNVDPSIIVNQGEAVLSLRALVITPKMVEKLIK